MALLAFSAGQSMQAEVTEQTVITTAGKLLQEYKDLDPALKLRAANVLKELGGLVGEQLETGANVAAVTEFLRQKLSDPEIARKAIDLIKQQGPLLDQIQSFIDKNKGLIDRTQWLLEKLVFAYKYTPGFLSKPLANALNKINTVVQGAQAVREIFDNEWVRLIVGKLRANPELRDRVLQTVTEIAEGALGGKVGSWINTWLSGKKQLENNHLERN